MSPFFVSIFIIALRRKYLSYFIHFQKIAAWTQIVLCLPQGIKEFFIDRSKKGHFKWKYVAKTNKNTDHSLKAAHINF
jgi:hypothetical protein